MLYLSDKGFVHRDLAARNILVSDKDVCKVYNDLPFLIDGGLSVLYCYTDRLLTLGCLETWQMPSTIYQRVGPSPSDGLLQRQCTTVSTRLPVTCGAMAVSSMRYGVSDTNPLKAAQTLKFVNYPIIGCQLSVHILLCRFSRRSA